MTAPVATVRQSPVGIRLEEGHGTLVTFANDPDISLWELGVTPPGFDGGDPVDTTTNHNTELRTKAPRQLSEMTDFTTRFAYDPAVITQLRAIINQPTTVTVTFPDGSTYAFYGYLKSFEPDEIVEGEMPEASVTIVCTNRDPVTGAEEGPTLVSVAGT